LTIDETDALPKGVTMYIEEKDVTHYERILEFFRDFDALYEEEVFRRLQFEDEWNMIPEQLKKRILAVDEIVMRNYAEKFKYIVMGAYIRKIGKRLAQLGVYPVPKPQKGYSERMTEYFKVRTEAHLALWENATKEDLMVYDGLNKRSVISARSALARVFWGQHLSPGQNFRLLNTDLKWYLDPDYDKLHRSFHELIEENLEYHEIDQYYRELNTYRPTDYIPSDIEIDRYLDQWKGTLVPSHNDTEMETDYIEALYYRWLLHCAYQKALLNQEGIRKLIELDKKALLSDNLFLLSRFERKFICDFLIEQGVFDKTPPPG